MRTGVERIWLLKDTTVVFEDALQTVVIDLHNHPLRPASLCMRDQSARTPGWGRSLCHCSAPASHPITSIPQSHHQQAFSSSSATSSTPVYHLSPPATTPFHHHPTTGCAAIDHSPSAGHCPHRLTPLRPPAAPNVCPHPTHTLPPHDDGLPVVWHPSPHLLPRRRRRRVRVGSLADRNPVAHPRARVASPAAERQSRRRRRQARRLRGRSPLPARRPRA